MSSIHLRHARVWQTHEYNAEWIHNGVEYCRNDPDGKRDFEESLVDRFGPDVARKKLLLYTQVPRRRVFGSPPTDGSLWWAQAAFDLGVSKDALVAYTDYVNHHGLVAPPQTKPPLKRLRGEGSISWLARTHEAHFTGHKPPEMDWATSRALAVSEFDRVRDTWEVWHTSPQRFFDEIHQRGKTTILSPQILANPDKDWVRWHKFDDALRGRVYSLTLAHMVWLHASELFEDLFAMGLTTSSRIERAYKKDRHLMLRLIACYGKLEGLALHLWSNMMQVVTASENIARCFIRRRAYSGTPDIQLDKSPTGHAAYDLLNDLEKFIVQIILEDVQLPNTLCDALMKELALNPHAADRFDAGTFDIFGELAIVYELVTQMECSTFGKELTACSRALHGTEDDLWALLCPVKRPDATEKLKTRAPWGRVYGAVTIVRNEWRDTCWRINGQGLQGPNGLPARIERLDYLSATELDDLWYFFDEVLWERSKEHMQAGQHRTMVHHFGLYDYKDRGRPTCTGRLLREIVARVRDFKQQTQVTATAVKATAPGTAHVTPTLTVAQSRHAYLAQVGSTPKEKVKTRKPGVSAPASPPVEDLEEEDVDENLPEFLPSGYKLGKKVLKVFHRILEDDTLPGAEQNTVGLQKGQIRWDAFEKAMKRIGFSVCQTAGSSVRFDPPAKRARPITFHRPHPDSLLTPHLIKWIGARLNRNYGWTVSTFSQSAGGGDPE